MSDEFYKKYYAGKTPEESTRAMIRDGIISVSVPFFEEVVLHYKSCNSMQKTADHFNISKTRVYQIVHEFKC